MGADDADDDLDVFRRELASVERAVATNEPESALDDRRDDRAPFVDDDGTPYAWDETRAVDSSRETTRRGRTTR